MLSLLFNIVIPVVILNKAHVWLGGFVQSPALWSLVLALAFPIVYGACDFFKNRKKNMLSLLGVVNVGLTGGLALLELGPWWFAFKEAVFPLLIGIFVLATVFMRASFFELILSKTHVLNWHVIVERVKRDNKEAMFKKLLKRCTVFFSLTFALSAVLNFFLALYIFLKPADGLSESDLGASAAITSGISQDRSEDQEVILNNKIARMTWMGFLVIGLPLTVITGLIFIYFVRQLNKVTGLSLKDVIIEKP